MRRFITLVGALGLTLMLALGTVASPTFATESGNGDNAHLCQQGGWAYAEPAEAPGSRFSSQADCVVYGAQGGSIVYVGPDIALVDGYLPGFHAIAGTGFAADMVYTVRWEGYVTNQGASGGSSPAESDANGSFTTQATWGFCGSNLTSIIVSVSYPGEQEPFYQEEIEINCE